ncbi:MAG: hypothetical protein AAGK04_06380 [Planctomycetota bacterium]
MPRLARRIAAAGLSIVLIGSFTSCGLTYDTGYNEGGSGASLDRYTWVSTSHQPKTVVLVDTRTEEPFWSVDIPVGQQLTIRFDEDDAPENIQTPAAMRWDLHEAGTRYRRLQNIQLVPAASVRRIDLELRPAPEPHGA